jgi:putative salt-induced outer membrane protein YdiY
MEVAMPKNVGRVLLLICFSLSCPNLLADQITLKNGDRLSGVVTDSDSKTMTLKSDFAGEVKIQWDAIREVSASEPIYITTNDGRVLAGNITASDGKLEVMTANSGQVEISMAIVKAVRSKQQQDAYQTEMERLQHPKLTDFWGGTLDTGLALARGNTQALTFNLSTKAARTTPKDKISAYALSLYSKNSATGKSLTTASLVGGGARYDFNISEKGFVFGQLDLLHDRFQQLDLRVVSAAGLGYHAIKNDNTIFDLSGGGSLNRELFTNGTTRTSAEVLLGEELSHKFSKATTFSENLQFFPNLTNRGEFRSVFNMEIATQLSKVLSWQVTVANLYLSNPPPGVKTTDLLLTTGLRFSFGRPI